MIQPTLQGTNILVSDKHPMLTDAILEQHLYNALVEPNIGLNYVPNNDSSANYINPYISKKKYVMKKII